MSRQVKKIIFSVFLCCALMLSAGCFSYGEQHNTAEDGRMPTDDSLIVIGVSQVGSESVWRTANTQSIQSTFSKDNGYFLIFENARQKQENQIKSLRGFISQNVDYIIFSPITEEGYTTVLEEAKEAEIPVIVIDRNVAEDDRALCTAWVGSDFENEGEQAGLVLEEYLQDENRQNEEINIIILKGTAGATATIGRSSGFDNIASKNSNWNIITEVDADFTTAKAKEEMTKLLKLYKDIDVVISQNDDMTFGAVEAVEAAGRKAGSNKGEILFISFDAVHQGLEMVADGRVYADIECNPNQGAYIEDVIQKIENNEEVSKINYVPERVFTSKNVGVNLNNRTY